MSSVAPLVDDFAARLRAVDGGVAVVAGVAAARDHIAQLCAESGGMVVSTAEALPYAPAAADAGSGGSVIAGAAAGVSRAVLGVAETGSVLLAPASRRDRLVSLLPPLHIVVLGAESLRATLDDAADAIRMALSAGTAYLTLVTGPSRTADIERVITVGAHGPRRLHVVVVEEAPGG